MISKFNRIMTDEVPCMGLADIKFSTVFAVIVSIANHTKVLQLAMQYRDIDSHAWVAM